MQNELKPYPAYKDSGMPWLGCLPERWKVRRLRGVTQMLVSNIDKHSTPGEVPVRLCNYIDVYKNERITDRLPFMQATASRDEADAFRLETGDVVITKDSEEWDDIAVPALVEYAAPDLVCGYHLAILRPRNEVVSGPYLARALQAPCIAHQFYVAANGVTRYGLSHDAIKSALVPVPPLSEQAAIVQYLDHADRKVRHVIRARQQLIKLLTEQKQAIIQRAVTRGLDPSVRLKPSGVPWLGDVPEHWDIRRLKSVMSFTGGGTPSKAELSYWTGDIPWVSPKDMKSDTIADSQDHITQRAVTQSSTKLVPAGSILMVVRSGILQRTIPIASCTRDVALNQDMKALTPKGQIDSQYFIRLVRGCEKALLTEWTKQGATVESIEHEFLANSRIPVPPLSEQSAIVQYLDDATATLDNAIDVARREIDLLREYRTRLIADVVTGKLDVRGVKVPDDETDVLPEDVETIDDVDAADQGDDAVEADSGAEENA